MRLTLFPFALNGALAMSIVSCSAFASSRLAIATNPIAACPVAMVAVAPSQFSTGALCIDRTEVTVAAYRACVAAGVCDPPAKQAEAGWFSSRREQLLWSSFCNASRSDRDSHPINCINHYEARTYCRYRGARLPTSVEWELAAFGAPTQRRLYPWGDAPPDTTRVNACGAECSHALASKGVAWGDKGIASDRWPSTAPVGSFPKGASAYGALDMLGNVWEWTDNTSHATSAAEVYRGRGWSDPSPSQSTLGEGPKNMRVPDLGFRCALDH